MNNKAVSITLITQAILNHLGLRAICQEPETKTKYTPCDITVVGVRTIAKYFFCTLFPFLSGKL